MSILQEVCQVLFSKGRKEGGGRKGRGENFPYTLKSLSVLVLT